MKVALVQCPVWGTYDPPLAIAQLSSCLKQEEHEVFAFDFNIRLYISRTVNYKDMWAWEQSLFWYNEENVDRFFLDNKMLFESCIRELIDTKANIVGFSVNAASKLSSVKIAKMIKDIDKNIIVVFGGPLFFEKRFVVDILNTGTVDIVIPGEGEVTLVELLRFIAAKKDISSCKGISFKYDGKIVDTGQAEPMPNLDLLPFLDYTDLPLSRYDNSRHIAFMASRGCVQRCVFCSSRAFWPVYRSMSGKRIFEEILFHKQRQGKTNPHLGHVDFMDLMFNGNMKYLIEFCDLLIEANIDFNWTANMIIRPEMTYEVIKKMKDSRCKHIIFGIESGSQRVLSLMRKNYRIADADRIVRDMHSAGISVTGNFMFGFPGETEDDFKQTLDFIRRNAKFLDRVYPSRTYCAIEEFSYLAGHLEEFGIKPNPPNHLFWESIDGTNTYPERLKRCREFSQIASYMNVEVGCGVQTAVDLDELFNLHLYYEYKRDFKNAADYALKYFDLERNNEYIKNKLKFYITKVNENDQSFMFDDRMLFELKEAVSLIEPEEKIEFKEFIRDKTEAGAVLLLAKNNSKYNDEEFNNRKLILESSPKAILLEVNGPCNSSCLFCSGNRDYDLFTLKAYRTRFEEKLSEYLYRAEEIILTGIGEFLLLPEAEKILDYFDERFPEVTKVFFTNGSSISVPICNKIVNSKSNITVNVSLHASNRERHGVLTGTGNFYIILEKIKYLIKLREKNNKPKICLIFIITTLNIDILPDFIKLAADLGVDEVICRYNYIYTPVQKYLSCFFRQDATNQILHLVRDMSCQLNIRIDLPPRFGEDQYVVTPDIMCRLPWSQIIFDTRGKISPCEILSNCNESLDTRNFMEVWNSFYYQNLRKNLIESKNSCFNRCLRVNPSAVNNFDSHVIMHNGEKV